MNQSAGSSSNPSGVQGVCPEGWHLPSDAEWTELTDSLGDQSKAAAKLKEPGSEHWVGAGGTNETGFTAIAGGYRDSGSNFVSRGETGFWWSATESGANGAWSRNMTYYDHYVGRYAVTTELGCSVRCVKD